MPSHLLIIFTLLLSLFLSSQALAQKLDADALAMESQWLDLLHYHRIGLVSVFESQADDPRFFLSTEGKTNPRAELEATYQALSESYYQPDSAICRFPARLHWLQQKGYLQNKDSRQCTEFQDWFDKIDAKSLTLAFPAAYLNSPSSMYGHTFIRINRRSGSNPLLDYSINYAANADPDDNELVFSYKGLTGGYPGVFSVLPYYQKIKEYSFLESRDVWEYDLTLNEAEVAQFVRHAWEIQRTHFDYFFFTENCSYHLLTLLDAASPRLNLSNTFRLHAIPADTVRALVDAGLVSDTHFRPSTMSLMEHMLKHSSKTVQASAKHLVVADQVEDQDISSMLEKFDTREQAQLLELAYQYSRYLSVRKKQDQKKQGRKAIRLLSARSKIDEQQVFPDYPRPDFRDDEGHRSSRLELAVGYQLDQAFSQISFRAAYHDRLDNVPGYLKGARLEMFNLSVRHFDSSKTRQRTRLEQLKLIDIASYSPRNDFLSPLSWEVSTGLKRPHGAADELLPFLSAGWGASYLWGNQQVYALGFFDLNLDDDIDKGYHLSTGPKIGWLSQQAHRTFNLEFSQGFDVAGAKFKQRSVELGLAQRIAKDWQVRLSGHYTRHARNAYHQAAYTDEYRLSLMHYF